MRAQGGGARTGWSASEGFVAFSLPPRLDPVVKAEREAGPGPPRSLQEEAGAGKEESRGPAWAGGRGEPGDQAGPAFSFFRPQDTATCSHSRTDAVEIQGPDGEPGAGWPICGGASLLGLHPATATGKPEFKVLAWDCRRPGSLTVGSLLFEES